MPTLSKAYKSLASLHRLRMRTLPITSFERRFTVVEPHTMLGVRRLANIYRSVCEVARLGVPGNVVECGVARGGSALLMCLALRDAGSNKKVTLFDTFEGMPEPAPGDSDFEKAKLFTGMCRGSLEDVTELLRRHGESERVSMIKGLYDDTLPRAQRAPIAFLHLDCDWYESIKLCLDTFFDQVSAGGIIQIDDYYAWAGCRRATDEFLTKRSERMEPLRVDNSAVWLQKPRT